ncbi:MAG: IS66 family insertion sequence element accessory protein TnpB [Myxococcus sp.]|nr:IS66 family insertion sequence element accessory protein TnpB [Myxococcus sp.]
MFSIPRAVRILLAAKPVDLRSGIDALSALVRSGWHENVYAGHLFVFISRRRDRVKILTWDNGGFVVVYKRLEQGRFRLPAFHDDALGAQLDSTQLTMLLDGIDVSHVRRPKKWSPEVVVGDRQIPGNLISPDRWRPARTARRTTASGAERPRPSKRSSTSSRASSRR